MAAGSHELQQTEEGITQEKINLYAELSGDYNPLHVDLEAAAASEFGGTIAHGPISLQPCFRSLTAWLGEDALPPGATVSVTYRHPLRPGDRVRFEAASFERDEQNVCRVDAQCLNQDETVVASLAIALPGPST
jgi:acyl dehydratase